MVKTIAQLWNGNIAPLQHFGTDNTEIRHLEHLLNNNLEKLELLLGEEEKKSFEKYYDCMNEYLIITNEQAFCDGFCLGARITAEAFLDAEKIVTR